MARKKKQTKTTKPKTVAPKLEFSKLVLACVMLTFFLVTAVGIYITVFVDCTQYGVLTTFVGAATTSALGFYLWKAKNENVEKIHKYFED
jgi:nicotinamide riboside transporter PnuC